MMLSGGLLGSFLQLNGRVLSPAEGRLPDVLVLSKPVHLQKNSKDYLV